ncbi:MAG: sugar transferase [Chloroflexota bacterium]|nr:sugar transferase [Chloroflexota bacterium]
MAPIVLPITRSYVVTKRAFDLIVSLLMLPVIVVILVACAIAIWIDSPGPIMYTQKRTGRHGHPFRMYKFRTMVRNADEMKEQLRHLSIVPPPDFKIPDDPRITRVGRFLRQTSLDELPQILNVLRGEMSLVGPRPTSFMPTTYELWHTERLEVPPGITGLWQIKGRNAANFDERLRLDIAYIDQMSLGFDLWIIGQTVKSVFRRLGA